MINLKRKLAGVGIVVIVAISVYALMPNTSTTTAPDNQLTLDSTCIAKVEPKLLYGYKVDAMNVTEGKVQRNENLSDILQPYNISYKTIHELSRLSKDVFDVRKIKTNQKYTIISHNDSLHTAKAMVYESSPTEYVLFNLEDSLAVERVEKEVIVEEKVMAGIIDFSLAESIDELGGSPKLTNDFVDVFAWKVDFFRIQKGDKFKVIYEEKIVDGEPVGIGNIKAIYFEHYNMPYFAFHFEQCSGSDFFDEKGNSLRKALLKYPLEFTRISSRYSGNRFHPVQKRWKAHRGTDFAAPKGTPIRAVGDGIVLQARYGKFNGKYVKIKHNATYSTQYLHMSRIAKGVRSGNRVRQGQVIGYVGSTGLATGNHLCYRFWKNGVQIDALKVKLPPSEPIKEELKKEFTELKNKLTAQLHQINIPKKEVMHAGL